jgi:hypothetical protein
MMQIWGRRASASLVAVTVVVTLLGTVRVRLGHGRSQRAIGSGTRWRFVGRVSVQRTATISVVYVHGGGATFVARLQSPAS